jgi:hypothetical protein
VVRIPGIFLPLRDCNDGCVDESAARIFIRIHADNRKKSPALWNTRPADLNPAASYSSIRRPYSTIGAGGLSSRVTILNNRQQETRPVFASHGNAMRPTNAQT